LNRFDGNTESIKWEKKLEYAGVMQLSDNIGEAIRMMEEIDRITATLKGLDCGSCGAPTCRALAEDVVTGKTSIDKCVFVQRQEKEHSEKGAAK
jgi:Na+-translocating ferredoxin:NAD+ oxidoreductase RNF subunit RnfB